MVEIVNAQSGGEPKQFKIEYYLWQGAQFNPGGGKFFTLAAARKAASRQAAHSCDLHPGLSWREAWGSIDAKVIGGGCLNAEDCTVVLDNAD